MDSLIVIFFLLIGWFIFVTAVCVAALRRFKEYKHEIFTLKQEVFLLREKVSGLTVPSPEFPVSAESVMQTEPKLFEEPIAEVESELEKAEVREIHVAADYAVSQSGPTAQTNAQEESPRQQTPEKRVSQTISALISFLRGGNIWVAGGVVFLVLGFTFAYTYIASVYHIPDEFKVSVGFLIGAALFAVGWKQRRKKRTFAMIIQGGGIGILYLSLFASAKIYEIFPVELVFSLMIVLIVLAVIISVFQSSEVLALFAVVIGYCVPLLLSSGSGNYIVLFSYYGLIGLAVLAIAFKKYWRYLNSVSFVFTFAVGILWGVSRYEPQHFLPVELFLVGFFLIFTVINILASLRQPSKVIENAYAMTLSFTYITVQMLLTYPYPYGQSIASATLGAFYIVLSFGLVKYLKERLKHLVMLYLALGIVFLNFALPFALDGDWTAGIWAVEGAALVVLGVCQKNRMFRYFGAVLSVLAAYTAYMMHQKYGLTPFINNVWIVRLLAAMSLLVGAGAYHKLSDASAVSVNSRWENGLLAYGSLGFGLILWYRDFGWELLRLYDNHYWLSFIMLVLMLVSMSALLFNFAARRIRWSQLRFIAVTPLAAAVYITLFYASFDVPFSMAVEMYHAFYPAELWLTVRGCIGWLPFFGASAVFIYQYFFKDKALPKQVRTVLAVIFIFITTVFLSANIARPTHGTFLYLAVAVLVSAAVLWLTTSKYVLKIPLLNEYRFWSGAAVAVYLLLIVLTFSSTAMPQSVLMLPFVNMLDLTLLMAQVAVIYGFVFWKYTFKLTNRQSPLVERQIAHRFNLALSVAGVLAFIWIHCALGRGVAELSGFSYRVGHLFDSAAYQLSIAVFWGITGFGLMLFGKKVTRRFPWLAGAVLLVFDSVKLLLIDLSHVGTLPRIGSFMALGLIFIVIGYFVPLPPKKEMLQNEEKK